MCAYLCRADIYTCFQDKNGCQAIRASSDREDDYKYCLSIKACKKCHKYFCDIHGGITKRLCIDCI